jgi:glycosyltransferase involved in cell wall biosynthesis
MDENKTSNTGIEKRKATVEHFELSVVIPCLNEEKTLPDCIEIAKKAMLKANISGEVIVSDNGSTDRSVQIAIAHGARVVHATKKGYGNALIHGMQAAQGKFLIMADADGSYDFNDIPKFVSPLREGADFVMGSRIKGNIHAGAMPFLNRYLGTPVLTFLINLFFKTAISDVNCGMRALTKKAFNLLNLKSGGMEFASEMVIKAALAGLKTVEVATSLFPDNRDRAPHLRPFRDGWRHLRFICLFAPTWLFLIPGMISLLTGSVIMTCILLLNLKNFGFFTMFFAQGLIYLGAQVIFLGISARGFAHFKAFLIRNDPVDRFMRSFTLEKGIALGTLLSITGVGTCGWVGYKILEFMAKPENAGIFNANLTKIGIVGSTIAILGLQMIFSSFYSGLFNVEVADDIVSEEAPLHQQPERL